MKENEIRPKKLHEEYLKLCKKDAGKTKNSELNTIKCPGCGKEKYYCKFSKNKFSYQFCEHCGSLFCSPRPSEKFLEKFYESAESSVFWATKFFPAIAESRRIKLFRKKAAQIKKTLGLNRKSKISICDVGAGYGIFLEEIQRILPKTNLCAIEPNNELAVKCREKGFETIESAVENIKTLNNAFDLVICSEVIEHVYSPQKFITSLKKLAKPGGNVLVTGLGYEGFDILTLQKDSKSVFPPHHINFLSNKGFTILFNSVGFKNIKIWTPGELDVDIVLNSGNVPEYLSVLASRGPEALKDLQKLLKKYCLSSHTWILSTK